MVIQTNLAALEMPHQALDQEICGVEILPSSDGLNTTELERRTLIATDAITLFRDDVTARPSMPAPVPAGKIKTAKRAAKLESSNWYESAARSIAISNRKPPVRG
jgi:hypothetical protein